MGDNDAYRKHKMTLLQARLTRHFTEGSMLSQQFLAMGKGKQEQYLTQHVQYMDQLFFVLKCVVCAFLILLASNYVAYQIATDNENLLLMVQVILGLLSLTLIC